MLSENMQKLLQNGMLDQAGFVSLLKAHSKEDEEALFARARAVREQQYGKAVFLRGLIEFTNYCKNDCYYCGIRRSNTKAERYRLTPEEILACCREGYALGFRTFVLQGGEDAYFTRERIADIIRSIKAAYPDCAITLSVGERPYEDYKCWYDSGADRYLLRHETATDAHYQKLHPQEMLLSHRKECLYQLREIGYQVGAGFMVGSPYQTAEHLAADLLFLKELNPHMVGIGPFIPHHDTPFADQPSGTLEQTLFLLGILRVMLPKVLLPATTALGTIHPQGREMGLQCGANVVMPNLSPTGVREKYLLYDNKICTGDESAQCRQCLERRVSSVGYEIVSDRGDSRVGDS